MRILDAAKVQQAGIRPGRPMDININLLNKDVAAGGPGSGRHSAGGGHFVQWDHNDPATHAFGKLYLGKTKEGGMGPKTDAFHEQTKPVGGKSGFGGSGHGIYEHQGNKFRIDRYANGKGFWGTDHVISKEK